jgi:hypothetical protein
MKDVGYGGKRAGTPPAAGPVDVPAAAAVQENTPTQPQSGTAPNARHRRESRRAPTKMAKASPLPHPPLSEHSKPAFAGGRRMKGHGRSSAVLTPSNSQPRRICYTRSADLMKKMPTGASGFEKLVRRSYEETFDNIPCSATRV